MTWNAYHGRKGAVREIVAIADRQRDLTLTELLDLVDADRTTFTTEAELLRELQMTWFQRLSGQLDRLMDEDFTDDELTAVVAWVTVAAEIPIVRLLLDRHRDEPALAGAFAHELIYLATSVGVPAAGANLLVRGERIVEEARALLPDEPPEVVEPSPIGLLTRLRKVIAA